MDKLKEIFNEVKSSWKEATNSVKFWNSLLLAGLLTLGIIQYELLMIALFIGSFLTIGIVIDKIYDARSDTEKHIWIMFMPITWIVIIVTIIGFSIYGLYKITIEPFNNWLNKEKEEK
jgi:uncharacterized BrkB/YihY/UPF0761 family membrane protein